MAKKIEPTSIASKPTIQTPQGDQVPNMSPSAGSSIMPAGPTKATIAPSAGRAARGERRPQRGNADRGPREPRLPVRLEGAEPDECKEEPDSSNKGDPPPCAGTAERARHPAAAHPRTT